MRTLSSKRFAPKNNRALIMLSASVLLAGVNAWVNPNTPPWSESTLGPWEIRLEDVLTSNRDVLWLDARPTSEYLHRHIPGALPLNEYEWITLLSDVLFQWQPGQQIIVYCSSQDCQSSEAVAIRLREEVGLDDVVVLKGGWEEWLAHEK